jgi:gas vesicle protein
LFIKKHYQIIFVGFLKDSPKKTRNMKDQAKIIVALLAGAAVGAAVSLLLAPSSGAQLREDIADYVDDIISSAKNKAESTANNLREFGSNTLERSKSRFRSAVGDLSDYKDGVVDDAKSRANNMADKGKDAINSIKSKVKSGADDLNDSVQDA